ncbi:hypothetical protein BDN71DRAFT_843188 [Pleurotus eryngii]|uniref:Uncharacterized protein n=1 Tax=Pleurotus eryngii TaxID=5323 RepID=A0A9P6ABL5_PLEER|nr:hypothetical protein BDN71DRAFT_843188 [Pleurotus eryngii]
MYPSSRDHLVYAPQTSALTHIWSCAGGGPCSRIGGARCPPSCASPLDPTPTNSMTILSHTRAVASSQLHQASRNAVLTRRESRVPSLRLDHSRPPTHGCSPPSNSRCRLNACTYGPWTSLGDQPEIISLVCPLPFSHSPFRQYAFFYIPME